MKHPVVERLEMLVAACFDVELEAATYEVVLLDNLQNAIRDIEAMLAEPKRKAVQITTEQELGLVVLHDDGSMWHWYQDGWAPMPDIPQGDV